MARRTAAQRSASARKAAKTRKRNAAKGRRKTTHKAKHRTARKTKKRTHRSPAQRAATRRLVALNKKRHAKRRKKARR